MTDQLEAAREARGRLVRETWVAWAQEQPGRKPGWLQTWEHLDAGQREVDMRIGDAVWTAARADAEARIEALTTMLAEVQDKLRIMSNHADEVELVGRPDAIPYAQGVRFLLEYLPRIDAALANPPPLDAISQARHDAEDEQANTAVEKMGLADPPEQGHD